MENNRFERLIFKLLKILGIISIIGGFLGEELLVKHNVFLVGHVYFISPVLIIKMVVTIVLFRIFIGYLERHISIKPKSM